MTRRFVAFGLLLLLGLTSACDSGPEGPGDLTGTLQAPDVQVGAVVLEVVGGGIEGFSSAGGNKVFWAQQDDPARYRVVVVGENPGEISFTVSVRNLGGQNPRATVVNAVDLSNRPLPVTGDYRIRFRR